MENALLTSVAFATMHRSHQAQAVIFGHKGLDDRSRAIHTPIIDDDDLRRIGLALQILLNLAQTCQQALLFIVGGHNQ
jgi:hypothetical protein